LSIAQLELLHIFRYLDDASAERFGSTAFREYEETSGDVGLRISITFDNLDDPFGLQRGIVRGGGLHPSSEMFLATAAISTESPLFGPENFLAPLSKSAIC
jgi:hypothetical protein